MNLIRHIGFSICILSCMVSNDTVAQEKAGKTVSVANNQYSTNLDVESIRKVVNDAAEWQIQNMPNKGRRPAVNPKYTGWADGVFLSALADWAEVDNSRNLIEWYEKIAEEQQWEVGHSSINPANDISVALMYAKIWQNKKQPRHILSKEDKWDGKTINAGGWKELIPTLKKLDFQMKHYPQTDNIKFEIAQNQDRWCWCDALYMAAPTYALYANITGNDEYREFMNREFWVTMETLYDKEERLVFRDTRFMTKKEKNGEKVFWGRGNGWVVGALARVMNFLPEDYHSRDKYEQYFVNMMSRIVELQGSDGYWRSSLLDPEAYPSKETSATGFYTYALWWGINNGLLDKETYLEPATRGWEAMVRAVQPSGMLGYVQAIGDTPQKVSADSNEVYGTAAFMLAGVEVYKLVGGKVAPRPASVVKPATYCRFVPERMDDFAWENDKIAFRAYGPALRQKGEDSGFDAWLKRVDYPIIDKWYRESAQGKSYHKDHGEGYDPYKVGASRGCGGLALWIDGKMVPSNVFRDWKIIKCEPEASIFVLSYAWKHGGDTYTEEKRIAIRLGDRLFSSLSTFRKNGEIAEGLPIAVGLVRHHKHDTVSKDLSSGWMSIWETIDGFGLGTGIVMDPSRIEGVKIINSKQELGSHALIITRTDDEGQVEYAAGYGWARAGQITTADEWNRCLEDYSKKGK